MYEITVPINEGRATGTIDTDALAKEITTATGLKIPHRGVAIGVSSIQITVDDDLPEDDIKDGHIQKIKSVLVSHKRPTPTVPPEIDELTRLSNKAGDLTPAEGSRALKLMLQGYRPNRP